MEESEDPFDFAEVALPATVRARCSDVLPVKVPTSRMRLAFYIGHVKEQANDYERDDINFSLESVLGTVRLGSSQVHMQHREAVPSR